MTHHIQEKSFSRRSFMTIAGGVAGVATLAAIGVPTGWATNKSQVDVGGWVAV